MNNSLTELDILKDVTTRLAHNRLDYMLTGSFAMNYYAQPRMTRDIDIVVALRSSDVMRVVEIFGKDYYVSGEAVEAAIENSTIFNLAHLESMVKVDMIIRKQGVFRQQEFDRRKLVEIADVKTWIVSKEDLILSKLDWARDSKSEMQYRDVRNLLATGVDKKYLTQWAEQLGVYESLKDCMNE